MSVISDGADSDSWDYITGFAAVFACYIDVNVGLR